MPEFLTTAFSNGPAIAPGEVAVRLVAALAFGFGIAAIYRFTRRPGSDSFAMTLLLLCVLIAMVTQVVGDNVARAFSLVGALSIVRFRTVVRDTQDTAYVILAVITGMAVGAKSLWVAGIGLGVVALAELIAAARLRVSAGAPREFIVKLRIGMESDPAALIAAALGNKVVRCELVSVATTKQGGAMDAELRVQLKDGLSGPEVIRLLSGVSGMQSVQLGVVDQD